MKIKIGFDEKQGIGYFMDTKTPVKQEGRNKQKRDA